MHQSETKNYAEIREHLSELMARMADAEPATMGAFGALHESAGQEGELSTKTKELIALAIGIAVHCDGCIAYHVHDAIAAGATRAEIAETIGVAVMMGGGPSVVYGCQALEATEQFALARA